MKKFVFTAALLAAATGAQAFELSSPDLEPGGTFEMEQVASVFGCTGDNVSPALEWSDAPEGTGAYALMVHDPDAPTGGAGFWHWIALNIPAGADGLPKGAGSAGSAEMPEGVMQVVNDYGFEGWGGPCPPQGDQPHRYDFTLYALPGPLEGVEGASKAVIGFTVNASALGKTTLQGLYGH